jgi:hypothetical protein
VSPSLTAVGNAAWVVRLSRGGFGNTSALGGSGRVGVGAGQLGQRMAERDLMQAGAGVCRFVQQQVGGRRPGGYFGVLRSRSRGGEPDADASAHGSQQQRRIEAAARYGAMGGATCRVQSAECRMQNAECRMQNANAAGGASGGVQTSDG